VARLKLVFSYAISKTPRITLYRELTKHCCHPRLVQNEHDDDEDDAGFTYLLCFPV